MKRIIPILIAIVVLLCACSKTPSTQMSSNLIELLEFMESGNSNEPVVLPISYDTVDELIHSISTEYTDAVVEAIEQSEKVNNKGNFKEFITNTLTDNYIYVPYYNDKVIVLRDEEGYSAIDLSPVDMYGLPCIFYHMNYDGNDVLIKTINLNAVLSKEKIAEATNKGVDWLETQIDKSAESRLEDYTESTYEANLNLKNKTVNATYENYIDDPRVHVSFVYDDILVSVWALPEIVTDDWFMSLSFEKTVLE